VTGSYLHMKRCSSLCRACKLKLFFIESYIVFAKEHNSLSLMTTKRCSITWQWRYKLDGSKASYNLTAHFFTYSNCKFFMYVMHMQLTGKASFQFCLCLSFHEIIQKSVLCFYTTVVWKANPLNLGWTTLSPIATSGELAMKVWRHSQNFCNFSDKRIVTFHITFSNFFNWTNLFHYLRLMAVVTE
jgi:hypothetical protein